MQSNTSIKKIEKIVRFRNIVSRKEFQRRVDELTDLELKLAAEVAKHYINVYLFSVSLLLSGIAIILAIIVINTNFNLFGFIFITIVSAKLLFGIILIYTLIGAFYLGLKFELYNELYLECLEMDNKWHAEEKMS